MITKGAVVSGNEFFCGDKFSIYNLILTRSQLNTGHALILNFFIQFENSVGFSTAPKPCICSVLIKRDVLMSEVVLYNIVHISWPIHGALTNGGVLNSGGSLCLYTSLCSWNDTLQHTQ